MKTIVVPTDFSPVSVNAVNYAADMALAIDASLVLVNVYQIPVAFTDVPVVEVSIEELEKISREKLESIRNDVDHITSGTVKIYIEPRLGDTVDELETLCNHVQPFAVVMGSHGATGLERMIMGSTTLTALRHLKWPIIVVPPGTNYKDIKKIGLACDFKNVVESVPAEFIKNLVHEFGAALHVMHVDYHHEHFTQETPLESAYLETMLGDIKPAYHFLNREDVVEGINEFAEINNLDMVVVVPRKHKLLEGLFHKSSSRELVTRSHIPIVSIHE